MRSTSTGAMPIDGSSSNSSRGSAISARPIASICCSPPDIVPAFCFSRSLRRGKSVKIRSMSSLTRLSRRRYAPMSRFSRTDMR
jgi:hypothetical protein